MQPTLLDALLASESINTSALNSSDITGQVRRVAIFTEAFLPKIDGVSRTALLTLKYLESTGRELIVFAPSPAPAMVSRTPIYAIPSLWLPFYPETRVAPPLPYILSRLRDFKPDLIHLFSPFSLGMIGMLAADAMDVPVIANYQTDLPAYTISYGYGWVRPTIIGLMRFLHNGCHLTLAPSQATLSELRSWGFRRLRRWERGVDIDRFTPARRSDAWRERLLAGRDPSRLLVLYVGRIAREKHLEALIDIARDPGLALTVVGGGNYLDEIRQYFAGTDAEFTGYLVGDDLSNAFAAADVFVFPGPEETFGQVVVEAMASGLPVIVTDRGGPKTLVKEGHNGFIVPVDDSAAFSRCVRQLRDDPAQRARMSQAARQTAEHRPWLVIMRQLEDYYDEALHLHARRAQLNRGHSGRPGRSLFDHTQQTRRTLAGLYYLGGFAPVAFGFLGMAILGSLAARWVRGAKPT